MYCTSLGDRLHCTADVHCSLLTDDCNCVHIGIPTVQYTTHTLLYIGILLFMYSCTDCCKGARPAFIFT